MVQLAERQEIIRQAPGQMIGGHAIGIIVLNVGYPLLPGNVANSTTYDFPVLFKVVEGADIPKLLAGDRSLLEPSLAAARELVTDGCRAIVGACGYFAKFQREMAEAISVSIPSVALGERLGSRWGLGSISRELLDKARAGPYSSASGRPAHWSASRSEGV